MITRQLFVKCFFAVAVIFCCASTFVSAAETRFETVLNNGGKATLIFADSPLKAMTENPFTIELHKDSGEAFKAVKLVLSLTMPVMAMPPNHPKTTWKGNICSGIAIFTMAGAWRVNVEVEHLDKTAENIVFDIEMVVMK